MKPNNFYFRMIEPRFGKEPEMEPDFYLIVTPKMDWDNNKIFTNNYDLIEDLMESLFLSDQIAETMENVWEVENISMNKALDVLSKAGCTENDSLPNILEEQYGDL